MIKKYILLLLSVTFLILAGIYTEQAYLQENPPRSSGKDVRVDLVRGPFVVFKFVPKDAWHPLAVVMFRSGDGGWGYFEDAVACALRNGGYEVIGIDSVDYANTDYDLDTLEKDARTISRMALAPFGVNPPPLVSGGWSMGAGQAIAVAGGPNRPKGLAGLLLASPLQRGRFGLREFDKMNILPRGRGTFAVEDFAKHLNGLRIVQWHGADDWIDSTAWLKDLTAVHQEHDLAHAGHTYDNASPEFLHEFLESADWIVKGGDSSGNLIGQK